MLKIVVVGAGGRLGAALTRDLARTFSVVGFKRDQLDLAAPEQLRESLGALEFDLLVNAAALTNVDYCEDHRAEAMQLNATAPRVLAEICRERSARFIHVSTDYVFDGEKREPYTEEDAARPISVYGESKRAGEVEVLTAYPESLVARVSWVFGPDRPSFVDAILKKARTEEQVAAVADKFSTPTYTEDIAAMLRTLLEHKHVSGILHLASRGACSWQEYAQWALDCCHRFGVPMKARTVGASSLGEMKDFVARRPVYTVLGTEKVARLTNTVTPDWQGAVERYIREHYAGKV
ncbi:MAG: dTDP-4-dehydrorhamnose reductase [Chthoniobacterales bacterium]